MQSVWLPIKATKNKTNIFSYEYFVCSIHSISKCTGLRKNMSLPSERLTSRSSGTNLKLLCGFVWQMCIGALTNTFQLYQAGDWVRWLEEQTKMNSKFTPKYETCYLPWKYFVWHMCSRHAGYSSHRQPFSNIKYKLEQNISWPENRDTDGKCCVTICKCVTVCDAHSVWILLYPY